MFRAALPAATVTSKVRVLGSRVANPDPIFQEELPPSPCVIPTPLPLYFQLGVRNVFSRDLRKKLQIKLISSYYKLVSRHYNVPGNW